MKRLTSFLLLTSSIALLSACNFFSQPADLQTENLQNEIAQTQIAAVRATATVNADRLLTTLENAQTAVGNADLQSTRIVATLMAQGTPFVDASGITPVALTAPPQNVDQPTSGAPQIANPLLTPQVSGQGSARGDSALVPVTPTVLVQQQDQPVETSGAPLTNIQVTEQVGSDDCPINPTNTFTMSATDIYVTAVANGTAAGTTFSSTWYYEGTQIAYYEWTPDFSISSACIWFHMPASEVDYVAGNYTVQLAINGANVGAAVAFTITSSAPAELNMDNSGG